MQILYFAWVKEKVGKGEEDFSLPATVKTVADLVELLKARGEGFAEALDDMTYIRVAVNQEYVTLDQPLNDSDEVAFFPPVTGG